MRVSRATDVGVIARQRRQDLNISQVELASRAGVTRQWLNRFERGNVEVSLSKVLAVLTELELKIRLDALDDMPVRSKGATFDIPRVEFKGFNFSDLVPNFPFGNFVPKIEIADLIPKLNVGEIMAKQLNVGETIAKQLNMGEITSSARYPAISPLRDAQKLVEVKNRIRAINAKELADGDPND